MPATATRRFLAPLALAAAPAALACHDDPVAAALPEIGGLPGRPAGARPITYRMLASMTAGLARDPRDPAVLDGPPREWAPLALRAIRSTPSVAAPGAEFHYTNAGYAFLGLALERAARRPYLDLVRERVLEPLGMTSSGFEPTAAMRARLATGSWNAPAGGVDALTPLREHEGRGFEIAEVGGGARVVGKDGGMPGYTAYVALDPDARVGAILLRNYNTGATGLRAAGQALVRALARRVAPAGAAR